MRKNGKITFCWMILIISLPDSLLFAQRVWSEVTMDRKSTYVGQPVEVRITVYTSTWFTSGVDLGNIKVNGAFTVYFRPVSRSIQVKGKTYPGVELIYHVFPYDDEDIVFPSLEITVETPPEGDYKGVKRIVKSQEKYIAVKPIPVEFDPSEWLVSTGVTVSDRWNSSLENVKVGDVIERRISRKAGGTVAELIPLFEWDSIAGVSQYPVRSVVENFKSKTDISASRIETMRYLFEQEGKVVIPEMVITWYHPYQQRLYKRTLKEITLQVDPNPDLGILTSIRDSLEAEQATEYVETEEEAPFTILGFPPRRFAVIVTIALVLLFILTREVMRVVRVIRIKKKKYKESEAWFFKQFLNALKENKSHEVINRLYRWLDELKLPEPSMVKFVELYGTEALKSELEGMALLKANPHMADEWVKSRNNFKHKKTEEGKDKSWKWINPE